MGEALDSSRLERFGAEAASVQPGEGRPAIGAGWSGSRDSGMRLAILEALYWDLAIPPHAVTVEVENGWVTLRGQVSRPFARHRAEWAARGAPDVAGVTNEVVLGR